MDTLGYTLIVLALLGAGVLVFRWRYPKKWERFLDFWRNLDT